MDAEVAAILERPVDGVKIHRVKMRLPASSKAPGWITGEQVRRKLGLKDGRRIRSWVKRGMVMGHIMGGARQICMVNEISITRFICNPMNWPWFKIEAVKDPHWKRLIELEKERWGDEWLTSKQAEMISGLDVRMINQRARRKMLTAVHCPNLDGRHNETPGWAYFWVLRSEVEALVHP